MAAGHCTDHSAVRRHYRFTRHSRQCYDGVKDLDQLCPARWPRVASRSLVRPSLGFRCSESILLYILITCPYFDNLEFDIFDAGGPQCHFIKSATIAVRIRTLSVR